MLIWFLASIPQKKYDILLSLFKTVSQVLILRLYP